MLELLTFLVINYITMVINYQVHYDIRYLQDSKYCMIPFVCIPESERNQTMDAQGQEQRGTRTLLWVTEIFCILTWRWLHLQKIQNLHFTQVQFTEYKYLNRVHLETINILYYVSHQSLAVQQCCAAATRNCPVCKVHNMLHLPGEARDVVLLLQ